MSADGTPQTPPGLTLRAGWWADLASIHATPPRYYHSLAHVAEVLERWGEVAAGPGWKQPAETFAAILLHDAVYVAGLPDNEARSAELARTWLPAWGARVDLDRVAALIERTADHGRVQADPDDPDLALFLDCDMAILGASPERFAAYDADVAREYAPVIPAEAWASGRRAFLEGLLAKARIFLSDYFHDRLDGAARRNLEAALR